MSSFLSQNTSQIVKIPVHRPLKELHTVAEIIFNRWLKSFKVRLTPLKNIFGRQQLFGRQIVLSMHKKMVKESPLGAKFAYF